LAVRRGRRPLAPPPALSQLRRSWLLRLLSQSPREQARGRPRASDRAVVRARRGLVLVLRRRGRLRGGRPAYHGYFARLTLRAAGLDDLGLELGKGRQRDVGKLERLRLGWIGGVRDRDHAHSS